MKIELNRRDGIDVVALLVVYEAMTQTLFEDNEPGKTRAREIGQEILKQLIDNGLVLTESEFDDRVADLNPRKLNFSLAGTGTSKWIPLTGG